MESQKPDAKTALLLRLLEQVKESSEPVLSYAIPHIFSRKLASLGIIREDILFVKSAFEQLQEAKNNKSLGNVITASLFYAAVSQYGRCFNENRGGNSKLEPSDLFSEQDTELSEAHREIMSARNSFVAHRDDNDYEQAVVIIDIPLDEKIDGTYFRVKSLKTMSPSPEKLLSYLKLCDFIIEKVESKFEKQAYKTKESLFKNLEPDQIQFLRIK